MSFNWDALLLGAASFLIIGLFHPLVIKGEYYFGKGIWPWFLAAVWAFCWRRPCVLGLLSRCCWLWWPSPAFGVSRSFLNRSSG